MKFICSLDHGALLHGSIRSVLFVAAAAVLTGCTSTASDAAADMRRSPMENSAGATVTREELVARLTRAGELMVAGADQATTDSFFATKEFRFHGPGGFESDYAGLSSYFQSFRAAFDDRSIRRGIIVVDGQYIACQTWIEGTFVREFTQSPAGPLPPNGKRVVFDLINIFRFDASGRIVEEWVRADYRSLLMQLGAGGK